MIRASRSLLTSLLLAATAGALLAAPATAATPGPAWRIESYPAPAHFTPGIATGQDIYEIEALNTGGEVTDGSTVTVTDELPPGFSLHEGAVVGLSSFGRIYTDYQAEGSPCEAGPPVTCKIQVAVQPGERLSLVLPVDAPASGPATVNNHITVSGGGAAPTSATEETPFDAEVFPFAVQSPHTSLTGADGGPETRAGAHPFSFRIGLGVNDEIKPAGFVQPVESPRDVRAILPPGLALNPTATAKCTEAQFELAACPDDSAVGVIQFSVTKLGVPSGATTFAVFNMPPPPGAAADFGFEAVGVGYFFHVLGGVDAATNYALTGETNDITQFGGLDNFVFDFWGDPSAPAHDHMRGEVCGSSSLDHTKASCPVPADPTPLLSMPSACSASLSAHVNVTSWQSGASESVAAQTTDAADPPNPVGVTGCEALKFEPTLEARPTTNVADSPSGLKVDLHVPQSESQNTLATANLKDTTLALPKGVTLNPSSANGLDGCSSAQIGLATAVGQKPIRFGGGAPSCPSASRLGTLEVDTPLVEDPLPGSVYLAKPYDNPFGSLLAIYLVVNDPRTGIVIKLPGHVEADPKTGQLTTTFDESPQLPFEDFKIDLFGGARGALRTPATCGRYSTTSQLTPWSGTEAVNYEDHYSISRGPGGSCATNVSQEPFSPSFDAGAVSPIAGAHSPFVVHLRREDATQGFSSVTLSPPQGLVGTLAGLEPCSAAALASAESKSGAEEQTHPSCPPGSEVGTAVAGAGAGPAPYYAGAKVYLAGPYKGAPLSFAIITPAVAGPFDLGTVVTRVAVHVDPATAQITADSDAIPASLEGIPLDVRTIDLSLDREGFTQNGTSCDPSSVGGQASSLLGAVVSLSARFQLAECEALAFKPKMGLFLKGPIKRGKYPKLTAVLTMPEGDANIASVSVALPHSEFFAQQHIRTICTRVQFAADQCPAGSVYGAATVITPLLGYPLTGNVYLRASNNKLPDLVPDLRGPAWQPIRLEADGRNDSIHGGLRNSFEFIPDAPFSKLVLQLQGGQKSLLQNSTNICAKPQRARVKYTAHNGDAYEAHPLLKARCRRKHRKHSHHHHKRSHRRAVR